MVPNDDMGYFITELKQQFPSSLRNQEELESQRRRRRRVAVAGYSDWQWARAAQGRVV